MTRLSVLLAVSVAVSVLMAISAPVYAGEADVVGVRATPDSSDTWRFDVTVAHADTGWDHYADKWDVVGPSGKILGTRVLVHPHENEQPFTRSLGGVFIPPDVNEVTLRAHDNVHKYGGREMTVPLTR